MGIVRACHWQTGWVKFDWLVSLWILLEIHYFLPCVDKQVSDRAASYFDIILLFSSSTSFLQQASRPGKFSKIHFYNNQNTLWTEDTNKYKISPRNITAISQIFPTFPMEVSFLTFSLITYYLHYVVFFFFMILFFFPRLKYPIMLHANICYFVT